MKMLKTSVIGVCLIMLVVGSANAATKWLEWEFEDLGGAINNGSTSVGTVGARDAEMNNTSVGDGSDMIGVSSPFVLQGQAVQQGAYGTNQRARSVDDIPDNTFDTGVSIRAIWQFHEEAPASSRFEMMQSGGPSWQNDTIQLNWDNYGTEYIGIATMAAGGIRYTTAAKRNLIEAAIGGSMIGTPFVLTGTYDGYTLAVYANGSLVADQTYATFVKPGNGYNRVEIGNDAGSGNNSSRPSTFDEVVIWQGALTANEVAADYQSLIPEPATIALLGLGGLLLRKRKA
jgi:hypothetical protein